MISSNRNANGNWSSDESSSEDDWNNYQDEKPFNRHSPTKMFYEMDDELFEWLKDKDIDYKLTNGLDIIENAFYYCNLHVIQRYLNDITDEKAPNLLMKCIEAPRTIDDKRVVECINCLIERFSTKILSCDYQVPTTTPLILAVKNNRIAVVDLILEIVDEEYVNLKDEYAYNAIAYAIQKGNRKLVIKLIQSKASLEFCTLDNQTCFTLARNHPSLRYLLFGMKSKIPHIMSDGLVTVLNALNLTHLKDILQLENITDLSILGRISDSQLKEVIDDSEERTKLLSFCQNKDTIDWTEIVQNTEMHLRYFDSAFFHIGKKIHEQNLISTNDSADQLKTMDEIINVFDMLKSDLLNIK